MKRLSIAAALPLLLLLPLALAAQQPGSTLPGRFEQNRQPRLQIDRLTAAEAREWNRSITRIADLLAANASVHSPPAGICTRLYSFVEQAVLGPRAVDEVSVQIPVFYDQKGCSGMSNGAATVSLNGPLGLLERDGTANTLGVHDAEGAIMVLARIGEAAGGFPLYRSGGEKLVILTRGPEPLTVPVSRERYLRLAIAEAERAQAEVEAVPTEPLIDVERWLREDKPRIQAEQREMLQKMERHVSAEQLATMRENNARFLAQTEATLREVEARQPDRGAAIRNASDHAGAHLTELRAALARLSPAERRAPACQDLNERLTGLGECNDYNRYVALNPHYFDPSLPKSAVQLLVVSTGDGTSDKENRNHAELRFRIFDTIDYAALAEVLH
jgi:hypothetical protein